MAENITSNNTVNILNNSRIIYLSGFVDEEKTRNVVSNIIKFEIQEPTKDILFYIDSGGGAVDSFIAIHDIMKMCRCDIATVCVGKGMSSGMMLLMSGKKGKRFITPNSRVLIHPLSQFSLGKDTVKELGIRAEETRRLQSLFESLIIKYTNITKAQIKKYMTFDSFLDAKECLKMGIVDHIITKSNILYDNINI